MAAGIGAGMFYALLTFVSARVLTDTIYSLGIMICFYYGLTAFACIWYLRTELFNDFYPIVFKLVFPLLGGLGLTSVLVVTCAIARHPTTAAARASAAPGWCSSWAFRGRNLVKDTRR